MSSITKTMKSLTKITVFTLGLCFTVSVSYGQDLIRVSGLKGKYGYGDASKKIQLKLNIKAQYDDGHFRFNSETGLAGVKLGEKWGMIDKTGATVLPFEYDKIDENSSDGLTQVTKGDKKGLVNKEGKLVLSAEYDQIYSAQNNIRPVRKEKGGKMAFWNVATSEFTPYKYELILTCIDGWFVKQNGKWALADTTLKELTPYKYDRLSQGSATAHVGNIGSKTVKISLDGKEQGDLVVKELSSSSSSKSSSSSSAKAKESAKSYTFTCSKCSKTVTHASSGTPSYAGCFARQNGDSKSHIWKKQ